MTFANLFLDVAESHPERAAVSADGVTLSYAQLRERGARLAQTLRSLNDDEQLYGVLGAESLAVYTGIIGTLMSGAGYVPLNPTFPATRTLQMLEQAGVRTLTCDRNGQARLVELLADADRPFSIIALDATAAEIESLRSEYPDHEFLGGDDLASTAGFQPPSADPEALSYVMFTSGSTGQPKGVAISHANLMSFVNAMNGLYDLQPGDRFSCLFDITFDASVLDIFCSWSCGGELCVVPRAARVAPANFIRTHELTIWFSMPSTATLMYQLKALKPGAFPSLRYSFFCGEPLQAKVTAQWQQAAENAVIENLYGPTEATVACMNYRWHSDTSPRESENGIVPIGRAFPEVGIELVDEDLQAVPDGEPGEICIQGPQTAVGYWKNPELTARQFVELPWDTGREPNVWYRTGDLARRNAAGDLIFVGRADNQVKILGYRVELGDIESCLQKYGGTQFAIAIPIGVEAGSARGVVGCLADSDAAAEDVIAGCRDDLPGYMVPREICFFDAMPLNVNGKIDRRRLGEMVEEARK